MYQKSKLSSHSEELLNFLDNFDIELSDIAQQLTRLDNPDDRQGRFGTAILVGKYLQHLKSHHVHTEETHERIDKILRRFCEVFGQLEPISLTVPLVTHWTRKQGWARSTQSWVALTLERMGGFGVQTRDVWSNPLKGLRSNVDRRVAQQE